MYREDCPRPLLWKDICYKRHIDYYCDITELYVCSVIDDYHSMIVE